MEVAVHIVRHVDARQRLNAFIGEVAVIWGQLRYTGVGAVLALAFLVAEQCGIEAIVQVRNELEQVKLHTGLGVTVVCIAAAGYGVAVGVTA